MAAPKQKCDLSREEAEEKLGVRYVDLCPLCQDLGADVKVGFHKSKAAAPAAPAAGQQNPTADGDGEDHLVGWLLIVSLFLSVRVCRWAHLSQHC